MESWTGVLVAIAVLTIFFLLIREFWCWYWKINERLEKLSRIEELLSDIRDSLKRER